MSRCPGLEFLVGASRQGTRQACGGPFRPEARGVRPTPSPVNNPRTPGERAPSSKPATPPAPPAAESVREEEEDVAASARSPRGGPARSDDERPAERGRGGRRRHKTQYSPGTLEPVATRTWPQKHQQHSSPIGGLTTNVRPQACGCASVTDPTK